MALSLPQNDRAKILLNKYNDDPALKQRILDMEKEGETVGYREKMNVILHQTQN